MCWYHVQNEGQNEKPNYSEGINHNPDFLGPLSSPFSRNCQLQNPDALPQAKLDGHNLKISLIWILASDVFYATVISRYLFYRLSNIKKRYRLAFELRATRLYKSLIRSVVQLVDSFNFLLSLSPLPFSL